MHTWLRLLPFTVIALQWAFTSASFPYILSVSKNQKESAADTPASSWFRLDSLWGSDERAKTNLDDYDTPSESEERLLKKHWEFIKKLKGKEEATTKKPKKKGHKGHKNDDEPTEAPLLSLGFLQGLFGEEPAAEVDVANETETSTTTTTSAPTMLIIDPNDSLPLPASEETVEVKSTPTPAVIKTKIRPNKKSKKPKPAKETNDEEDSEQEEDDADEDSEEDDEENEDEEDDKHNENLEDGMEIILDTAPKGPDGSDVMEPADIKMLGKKADLYLRLNKAHKSAKDFLNVFKGVYVDYVKHRPHVGIEFGTRGRSISPNAYKTVNRMGEEWNYRRRSQLDYPVYHQIPKVYFSSYRDYDEYRLPQQLIRNNIFARYMPMPTIREEKYVLNRPIARTRSNLHFPFPHYYAYELEDSYYDYIY